MATDVTLGPSGIRQAVKIYRELSRVALATNNSAIHIRDLRAAFKKASILCVDLNGSPSKDASISLKLNKHIGTMRDAGIAAGKWADKDAFKKWKSERFATINRDTVYEDFGDMFEDLD
tara:strand:+ start:1090 stop:1446 length:357 start_codon:yes stop_codon:yes gene_type:complete